MGILEAHLNDLFCQNMRFSLGGKGFKINKTLKSGGNLPKYSDTNKSPSCRLIVPKRHPIQQSRSSAWQAGLI